MKHQRGAVGGLLNTDTPSHTRAEQCTAAGVSIASERRRDSPDSLRGRGAITNPGRDADRQQTEADWKKQTACVFVSRPKQTREAAAACDKKNM